MPKNIEGLIVEYHDDYNYGVVLLRHKSEEDFPAFIRRYMSDVRNSRYWFAKFDRSSMHKHEWDRIENNVRIARYRRRSNVTIDRFLQGTFVTCAVAKIPNWNVLRMNVNFEKPNAEFSKHRRKRPTGRIFEVRGSLEEKTPDRLGQRMYAKNLVKPDNIRRPFRG